MAHEDMRNLPPEYQRVFDRLTDLDTARMALRWALEKIRNTELSLAEARRELRESCVDRGKLEEKADAFEREIRAANETFHASLRQFAREKELAESQISELRVSRESYQQLIRSQTKRIEEMRDWFERTLTEERKRLSDKIFKDLRSKKWSPPSGEGAVVAVRRGRGSKRPARWGALLFADAVLLAACGLLIAQRVRLHHRGSLIPSSASVQALDVARAVASPAASNEPSSPADIPVAAPLPIPPAEDRRARPVDFVFDAPEAEKVHLLGAFLSRFGGSKPMFRDAGGRWRTTVYLLPDGVYEYRFEVVDSDNIRLITTRQTLDVR